jgi:hypothetical protein
VRIILSTLGTTFELDSHDDLALSAKAIFEALHDSDTISFALKSGGQVVLGADAVKNAIITIEP